MDLDLINSFGEFEIYWDGEFIGKNGNPGEEVEFGKSGEMWRAFKIPKDLSKKGEHLLALKRSVYYFPTHTSFNAFVNDYDYLLEFSVDLHSLYVHLCRSISFGSLILLFPISR